MKVAGLVRAGQQVPGHIPQPGGGVDQVGGTTKRGDLCKDPVDGGLQGDLQRVEVSCRGEGPGVLQGQYLHVVAVQPGVPQGQRGVHRGLLDEGQQGRCDELTHVRGRGPEVHSGGEVAGAGHLALQRCDGGGVGADVGGVLGGGFQRRVLGEDEAELPGGDALQLDDRGLGDAAGAHGHAGLGKLDLQDQV